ncbi:hypothetical protein ACQ5SO_17105 [Rhodovulum sp. DZ06]|uniref:hypothetical protein n=1 Tax=Rhodovulum sp. DZ06 TaxID=3425126 RepID=UPI003D357848
MRLETYRSRAERLAAQAEGAAITGQPQRAAELRAEAVQLLDEGGRALDAESLAMMRLRDTIAEAPEKEREHLARLTAR